MNGNLFSPRMLALWLAIAAVLVVAALYFGVFGSRRAIDTVGPSSFSTSAIGHAGIADVLRRLGVDVVKSQSGSTSKVRGDGLLIVAEPSPFVQPQAFATLLNAKRVLLVLPKWNGIPSRTHHGWIDKAIPVGSAGATLGLAAKADLIRSGPVAAWTRNDVGPDPTLAEPVQLMTSTQLQPVVAAPNGMLVGELRTGDRRLWILSDPDVIANHGIAQPNNAAFAVALINALRGPSGNVVFDETIHGFAEQPNNPFRVLFEFPFVLATLQGVVAVGLLLWATMGRFGAPLPPPPPLQAGKYGLIQNTAKLFDFAGYQAVMVQRYVQALMRDMARQLHAPPGLSEDATAEWLARVGRARGVDFDCEAALRQADDLARYRKSSPAPLAALAHDIFRWKQEITDGVSGHSRRHRVDSERSRQGGGRPG